MGARPAVWATFAAMSEAIRPRLAHRPEIEGLRAVAVAVVVLYHAGVPWLQGGYVGVDVFFVVSGFLITSLLLTERQESGRISLGGFYARRFRRLLPAAALVLACTAVASRWWWEPLRLSELRSDVWHAVLFVANWGFVSRATDYLSSDLAPSPLQHWWSLAVEEQFYLLWPLLVSAVCIGAKKLRARVGVLAGVVVTVSLVLCVTLTSSNQPWAFFMLPSRAWEMAAGGLLAAASRHFVRLAERWRALVGWCGLVGLVAVVVGFDETLAFPGWWALLPVVATSMLLFSGDVSSGPASLLRRPALGWLGARSYSLYLWHWPVLVLAASAAGRPLLWWERSLAVGGSVLAAAFTFALVEQPVRTARLLVKSSRASFMAGASVSVVAAVASSFVLSGQLEAGSGQVNTPLIVPVSSVAVSSSTVDVPSSGPASTGSVTSPGSSAPGSTTSAAPTFVRLPVPAEAVVASQSVAVLPGNVRPSLAQVRDDVPSVYGDGCHADFAVVSVRECVFGDPGSQFTVVLFGDSHAAQWFSAVREVADGQGWRLVNLTKKGCPVADVSVFLKALGRQYDECDRWRESALSWIEQTRPDLVVLSQHRYTLSGRSAGGDPDARWREGFAAALGRVAAASASVVVLSDSPTPAFDVPSCVSKYPSELQRCATAPSEAIVAGRVSAEREVASSLSVVHVDVSGWVCGPQVCPVVVGDMLVYRDTNHLSDTYVRWLVPYVREALVPPG